MGSWKLSVIVYSKVKVKGCQQAVLGSLNLLRLESSSPSTSRYFGAVVTCNYKRHISAYTVYF